MKSEVQKRGDEERGIEERLVIHLNQVSSISTKRNP